MDPFTGSELNQVIVATDSKDYKSLLSKMESIWKKHIPSAPFEYVFVDEEVQKHYKAEITLARIINLFAIMAVIVSCLGVFGLSAFSAEQRTKEIGIRKVLGAGMFRIVTLLSGDFLKLVAVAILIASPLAWWATNKWLQSFAYRTDISWWMFAAGGAISVFVAMITVSFQSIKAAAENPVKSLRRE